MRCIALLTLLAVSGFSQTLSSLRRNFETPPDDARIMMRWWWFGAAVSKPELERELRAMKEGGIGGVEVQPVYPLVLDHPETGIRNLPYLSDEFIDALRFAAERARERGLGMAIRWGGGWRYGGPHVPVTGAAENPPGDRVLVPADSTSITLPSLENGEKLISAFLARGDGRIFDPDGL